MNHIKNMLNRLTLSFMIVITTLCLTACSTTKLEKINEPSSSHNITKDINIPRPQKFPKTLLPIKTALDSNKERKAEKLHSDLLLSLLSPEERIYYEILGAEIAWRKGDLSLMDDHLALLKGELPLALILNRFSDEPTSLIKLVFRQLRKSTTNTERITLRKILWSSLLKLESSELSKILSDTTDSEFIAWLNLAQLIHSTYPLDLQKTLSNLPISAYDYPTLRPLPGGLEELLIKNKRDDFFRIALLLPLSGRLRPASEAIRDGFLEAYFHARNQYKKSAVHILDMTKYEDISEAYLAANEIEADYVVGPLEKRHVSSIKKLVSLPIPTLTLNRSSEESLQNQSELNQLSLSPTDEAMQIANIAFSKGFRKTIIISPQDTWGRKMSDTVAKRWSKLGGKILAKVELGDPSKYSQALEKVLHLKQSQARAIEINKAAGSSLNFQLRRRQDVDVIFLLAGSFEQARSISPLLKFHFAGDIPKFATSKIYYGLRGERNRDLNGITLVDMPEILNSPHLIRKSKEMTSDSNSLRLHALGLDAFIVQYFLNLHDTKNELVFLGHSGVISIQENGQVLREAITAEFVDGKLVRK